MSTQVRMINVFQISVMKAKLNESLGIPAGKQKLQYEVRYMIFNQTHVVKQL